MVSSHGARSQEQLKPKTAEEAELADTLEQDSRAEGRDKRSHPYQGTSQLSQGKTELCVHKTRSDWDTMERYKGGTTMTGRSHSNGKRSVAGCCNRILPSY